MSMYCPAYTGGLWHFYDINFKKQKSMCMMLNETGKLKISSPLNGFEGDMSVEAACIAVNFLALSWLFELVYQDEANDYDYILEYADTLKLIACNHPEAALILCMID